MPLAPPARNTKAVIGGGGTIRFDVAWTDDGTDRWFYPIRVLDLPGESLAGAKAIEFEVKSAQDKVENNFAHSLAAVMAV